MGTGQADEQQGKSETGKLLKKMKGAGVQKLPVCEKGVFLAGTTRALNCTRLLGAVFVQQELITGKILAGVLETLESRYHFRSCCRRTGVVDKGDCEEECLPMESSDIVYAEVWLS